MSRKDEPYVMFIVKRGTVTRADIQRAQRLSRVCIIESDDPSASRYFNPPAPVSGGDGVPAAAVEVLRKVNAMTGYGSDEQRQRINRWFVEALLSGPQPVAAHKTPEIATTSPSEIVAADATGAKHG